jgi:hypothetical protein
MNPLILLRRSLTLGLGAVAALALAAPLAADAANPVLVVPAPYAQPHRAVQRPTAVEFTMTGGDFIDHLHWISWGGSRAIATGTVHRVNCKPDCASSGVTKHAGRLVLSKICHTGGHAYYTRATYTYTSGGRSHRGANLGEPPCGPQG